MVYILLADGCEEIEALTPYDMLLRAGIEVKTVSMNAEPRVTGAHGITFSSDITMDEVKDVPEMLVLPGGMPGTTNLDNDARTHKMIRATQESGGYLAAICAAPMILGYSGFLVGKTVTFYPGFDKFMIGATRDESKKVITDGKVITARGMGAAVDFGAALIAALKGDEAAEKVMKNIRA